MGENKAKLDLTIRPITLETSILRQKTQDRRRSNYKCATLSSEARRILYLCSYSTTRRHL